MSFKATGRNMDNKRKPKSLTKSDKINILAQGDGHNGKHVKHVETQCPYCGNP
jgi:hypothetical protein